MKGFQINGPIDLFRIMALNNIVYILFTYIFRVNRADWCNDTHVYLEGT
jgi:hypothetical protein